MKIGWTDEFAGEGAFLVRPQSSLTRVPVRTLTSAAHAPERRTRRGRSPPTPATSAARLVPRSGIPPPCNHRATSRGNRHLAIDNFGGDYFGWAGPLTTCHTPPDNFPVYRKKQLRTSVGHGPQITSGGENFGRKRPPQNFLYPL